PPQSNERPDSGQDRQSAEIDGLASEDAKPSQPFIPTWLGRAVAQQPEKSGHRQAEERSRMAPISDAENQASGKWPSRPDELQSEEDECAREQLGPGEVDLVQNERRAGG